MKVTGWVCNNCKKNAILTVKKNEDAITVITEQIEQMKQATCQLQAAQQNPQSSNENNSNNDDNNTVNINNEVQEHPVDIAGSSNNYSETALIVHLMQTDDVEMFLCQVLM